MEYFIQCALDGLADLLEKKAFRIPSQVKEKLAEYEVENNPVLLFIEDNSKSCPYWQTIRASSYRYACRYPRRA